MKTIDLFFDEEKQLYYSNVSILKGILIYNKQRNGISYDRTNQVSQNEPTANTGTESSIPTGNTNDVMLTVVRSERFTHKGRTAAYGKLYVNGEYWFDTGERNLLTPGTYPVAFRKEKGCTMTGRADWMAKGKAGDPMRRFAVYSKGYVPLVLNTKGRAGIRIHQGTSVAWSEGCLITGNLKNGKLENSWECWKKLYDYCYNANSVTITYQG